jgi:hypothetical protein
MIIKYYEYMTTQYFVQFFLSIRKHIYLPHAQTAIFDSKVNYF